MKLRQCVCGLITTLALIPLGGPALAQPSAPSVSYPTATGVPLNPTVFFTAYSAAGGDRFDFQRDFEVQIADAGGNGVCEAADFTGSSLEYSTDNATGSPPDCLANEPRCQGAGMAHMVTADGAYAGVFGGGDSGRTALSQGNRYCVRVRVRGYSPTEPQDLGWSAWSAINTFDTVAYDGVTRYVSAGGDDRGGSNNCSNLADPCAKLTRALQAASPGDTILVRSGTYLTARNEIDFNNLTDRLYIRGADAGWSINPPDAARPVLRADYTGASNGEFMKLSGMSESVIEDLVIQGHPNCDGCATWAGGNVPMVYTLTFLNIVRSSLINVDFTNNLTIVGGPATDLLYWDVFNSGIPAYTNLYGAPEQKRRSSVGLVPTIPNTTGTRMTFKGVYSDNGQHSLSFDGSNHTDVLVEETELYRSEGHVYRPAGENRRHTLRRVVVGEGLEGAYYETRDTSIHDFVAENNTFYNGLTLCDNGGNGSIESLVLINNVFGGRSRKSSRGTLMVQDHECGQGPTSGNILNPNDRVFMSHNLWWWTESNVDLIRWDCENVGCSSQGTVYDRCAGGPGTGLDYRQWMARPEVFDTLDNTSSVPPSPTCADSDNDSINPDFVWPTENQPTQGPIDMTPKDNSPLIDAGMPGHIVPRGGGNRVDVGAIEISLAPVIRMVNPAPGEPCAAEGLVTLTVGVQDADEGVDTGSITARVFVDNIEVTSSFTTAGAGQLVTVNINVPGGLAPTSLVRVEVTAADLAVPAHVSSEAFTFNTTPVQPTGFTAG